jgi:hypothetical protein
MPGATVAPVGWRDGGDQQTSARVDEEVTLHAVDLLAVVADQSARDGRLDRLGVDDGGRRMTVSALFLPVDADEHEVDRLEQSGVAPRVEVALDGGERRKLGWKKPPLHAGPEDVKHRLKQLARRPFPRTSLRRRKGKRRSTTAHARSEMNCLPARSLRLSSNRTAIFPMREVLFAKKNLHHESKIAVRPFPRRLK